MSSHLFTAVNCSRGVTDSRCCASPVTLICSLTNLRRALPPLLSDALSYTVSTVNSVSTEYHYNQQRAVSTYAWLPTNYIISEALWRHFFTVGNRNTIFSAMRLFSVSTFDIAPLAINVNSNVNSSNCGTACLFSAVLWHLQSVETALGRKISVNVWPLCCHWFNVLGGLTHKWLNNNRYPKARHTAHHNH